MILSLQNALSALSIPKKDDTDEKLSSVGFQLMLALTLSHSHYQLYLLL